MADLFEVERDVSFPFDFRLIAKDTKVSNVRIDQIAFLTAETTPAKTQRRDSSGRSTCSTRARRSATTAPGYGNAISSAPSRRPRRFAAASQRTTRIGLGAAVIQMGYENPFRLAEDLATVDVLSSGRLNVGQRGAPIHGRCWANACSTPIRNGSTSHARVARLRRNLAGDWLGDEDTFVESAAGKVRPRVASHRA